jgi:predicted nucleotidyltransferase
MMQELRRQQKIRRDISKIDETTFQKLVLGLRKKQQRPKIYKAINEIKRSMFPTAESLYFRRISKKCAEEVANTLKKHKVNIECCFVSGSTARGKARKTSDIDMFFIVPQGTRSKCELLALPIFTKYNTLITQKLGLKEPQEFIRPQVFLTKADVKMPLEFIHPQAFWTKADLEMPLKAFMFLIGKSKYGEKKYNEMKREIFKSMEKDKELEEKMNHLIKNYPEFLMRTKRQYRA